MIIDSINMLDNLKGYRPYPGWKEEKSVKFLCVEDTNFPVSVEVITTSPNDAIQVIVTHEITEHYQDEYQDARWEFITEKSNDILYRTFVTDTHDYWSVRKLTTLDDLPAIVGEEIAKTKLLNPAAFDL
tara:strand:+ start:388 stop:774 length:387 start_codon:yes stop_codon:yes gene_type:complete